MHATPSTATGPIAPTHALPLRKVALRGGTYLAVREVVGAVVRLAGLVVVTRQIGPSAYGIYTAASTYVLFGTLVAQMGAEVFLIRLPGPLSARRCNEVFTLLLVTSAVVVAVGLALSWALAPWIRPFGVTLPVRVLLLSIPVNVLWAPSQAAIERKFAYRRMGMLELGGDFVLYATAVPLALMGEGAWSLVAGFFAWQAWLLVGSFVLSGLRPRFAWSRRTSGELLRHGASYSLCPGLLSARMSLATLAIGAIAGAQGVGYVGFATRLVSTVNFTERGMQRVGMVAISRARDSRSERIGEAMDDGMLLQTLVTAAPFVAFGIVARWVLPDVFGRAWLPALSVYVLLALAAVLKAPSVPPRVLLFVLGRNMRVAVGGLIELLLVVGLTVVTVRAFGVVGFGIASVVGAAASLYVHRAARRYVALHYRRLILPVVALVPPLLVALVPTPWGFALLAPLALLALSGPTRRDLGSLTAMVRATLSGGRESRWWRKRPEDLASSVQSVSGAAVSSGAAVTSSAPRGTDVGTNGKSPQVPADAWLPGPLAAFRPDLSKRTAVPVSGLAESRASVGGRDVSVDLAGDGNPDLLLETDPVTGLRSAGMLVARVGRLLGTTRSRGWNLLVVALAVDDADHAGRGDSSLVSVAAVLRSELRFDDSIARVGPGTFVVALPFLPQVSIASQIVAHLESAVSAGTADRSANGAGPHAVRTRFVATPLPCEEEADRLVREVVDGVRA